VIALSDHGQSQGDPFASRYGTELSELCRQLTQSQTTGVESSIEGWGRVDSVLEDLSDGGASAMSQAAAKRVDHRMMPESPEAEAELVVLGSGNLGLVYVPGPRRLTLAEIEARWPALVPGLAAHPGIGFVAALGEEGPVVIGPAGRHHLATGVVEGEDPMAAFDEHAPAMLLAAALSPMAPELYVNSAVDPDSLEVAAFEPLVGCHGGLGGWQDRGFVLAPPTLLDPADGPIIGGEALHRRLVAALESLGHRTDLPTPTAPTT
jgi:hypothetical protein